MKWKVYISILLVGILSLFPVNVWAKEKITFYFFHGNTCAHCQAAWEYLDEIKGNYPDVEIVGYEVFDDENNAALMDKVKEVLGSDSRGVPFFVVGERYLTGFNEMRKEDIKAIMDYYLKHPKEYTDVVAKVISGELPKDDTQETFEEVHPVDMNERAKQDIIKQIAIFSGLVIILSGILVLLHKKKW